MNKEFIRQNYFEILLCIGITCGGLFRLLYPELRELEMKDLPITDVHEHILIAFELSAVYFIFYSTKQVKNIYLGIYVVGCILVTFYYLSKKSLSDNFSEMKKLCIFPDDIKSIWYHLVYVYILIYLIYIKQ
jgi:hypothetical protein